ncbi:MAG: hypothetical protein GC168_04205 [Candidatus Hydrogenedens sp.]|nr:hypothetical protein [Candidatus Hydrogenedens sp.]
MRYCVLFLAVAAFAAHAEPLRMNQIQIIGTHNSYHQSMGAEYFKTIGTLFPEALEWDYQHLPLDQQLEHGVRSFELDLHWTGSGFRVLHVPHYDNNSSCAVFPDCLGVIKAWSDAHPKHVPIVVLLETKDELNRLDPEIFPYTPEALDVMDEAIRGVFPEERLLTPDRVRGEANTLEEAVTSTGWPELDSVRGTVLFVLHDTGRIRDWYLQARPSAEGRAAFPQSEPGEAYSAFIIENNPYSERTGPWLKEGYYIRTRADGATPGDKSGFFKKRDQAFACGAQVIHTDYPPGEKDEDSGYVVEFEGGATMRCNPVTHSEGDCPALEP